MTERGSTTVSEGEVEDRLRRTFATRVGDMAAGNGAVWRAIGSGGDGAVLPRPGGDTGGGDRRRRRRVLAVAASLLVAAGVAAVALAAAAGTGDGGDGGVADGPGTTAPSTTVPGPTTTSGPSRDGSSCPVLSFSQGDDRWITVSFEATSVGADVDVPALLGDQWRPVEAGPNRGYVAEVIAGSPSLWLTFDTGIVRLESGGVTADELIAVGATVTRDSTGCYTAPTPQGWSREEMAVPAGGPGAGRGTPAGTDVERFVNANGASYNAIWYPDWTRDDLPEDLESVTVSDGQAYVGTLAPAASDMWQLWIVYDDGVLELQAGGMTRDELVAAGNGVHRAAGTDEFALTPPPGYAAEAGS